MKKSKIFLLASIVFVFFFSLSFDHHRFRQQKSDYVRTERQRIRFLHSRQSFRNGERHYASDRILVKFNPTLPDHTIETTINAYQLKKIKQIPELDIYVLKVPEHSAVEETIYALSLNPDVAHAAFDHKTYIMAIPKPTDNFFNWQYYLFNEGQEIGFPGPRGKDRADIKALEAWEETKGDEQVTIAVIDTGIDFDHPDLLGKTVSRGYDFANDDNDAVDDHGHGTFVSGLAAANTNNGIGIAGVSWNSKILPVKSIDTTGFGRESWLVQAIIYAVDNGADVILMSLGFIDLGPGEVLPLVEDALEYAYENGIVCVASAGNEGSSVIYPAASDKYCIAVAATDYNDNRPYWSNFGPEVDVAAPGVRIIGPVPAWFYDEEDYDFIPEPYGYGRGTSASAAIVAGFVALIKSIKPWLEPDEIMDVIRFSADDVNADEYPGLDEFLGYGRINMEKALIPLKITGSK